MKEKTIKRSEGFPQIPDMLAIVYVAITIVIMAYSFLFKIFPILIFMGIWFAHIYYKKTFTLRLSADMIFALFLPVFCCYSALWSDYPTVSLYAGMGLIGMVACVIIIARTVRAEAYIKGITLGTMVTLIATLMSGHTAKDEFTGTLVHVGLFTSKNEAGFFAELGVYAAVLIMFSRMALTDKFFFGLLPLVVSLITLYTSKSASSDISLIIALVVTCVIYFLHKLSRPACIIVIGMGILSVITLGLLAAATNADVFDPILKIFGKDSTLTGRTYLWAEGIRNGLKKPILGYGYFGFWQPGRPEAEHYWHKFDIPGKSGFHFHNLFIQSFVDLGAIGLALVILLIVYSLYKSLRAGLKDGLKPEIGLALGVSVMFLIRAFVEVDLFGPFGLGPLLYFSIIPRLAKERLAKERGLKNDT